MTAAHPAQPSLFEPMPDRDPCARRHRGAETSREAFTSTPQRVRSAQRERVFEGVRRRGARGFTTDEISQALDIAYTAASARMSELAAASRIVASGDRRRTSRGKTARVMVAVGTPEVLHPTCLNGVHRNRGGRIADLP